jgi:hypothetical protein
VKGKYYDTKIDKKTRDDLLYPMLGYAYDSRNYAFITEFDLSNYKNDYKLQTLVAASYYQLGIYEDAIEKYFEIIKNYKSSEMIMNLFNSLYKAGYFSQAKAIYCVLKSYFKVDMNGTIEKIDGMIDAKCGKGIQIDNVNFKPGFYPTNFEKLDEYFKGCELKVACFKMEDFPESSQVLDAYARDNRQYIFKKNEYYYYYIGGKNLRKLDFKYLDVSVEII